jgi:hypothetical protein
MYILELFSLFTQTNAMDKVTELNDQYYVWQEQIKLDEIVRQIKAGKFITFTI